MTNDEGRGKRRTSGEEISPVSDAPTSPQPTSPKCSSTLCFSALKTSLLDIASGDGSAVGCWARPCPDVETDVDEDGGSDAMGMNSTRSQRFCRSVCSIAANGGAG